MNDTEISTNNNPNSKPQDETEQKRIIPDRKGRLAGRFRTQSRRRASISAFAAVACFIASAFDFWIVFTLENWQNVIWDPLILVAFGVLFTCISVFYYRKDAKERNFEE